MNFHSLEFLGFFALVLGLFWWAANRRGLRTGILLVASLVFYGSYELWYLSLILFSTVLDWWCGNLIQRARERDDPGGMRRGLYLSLLGNLGVLGFFKYTDWVFENLELLSEWLELGVSPWAWRIGVLPEFLLDSDLGRMIVPVGISFYTFQTLSYTIDIYRGQLKPARTLSEFALFVSFFPQLVAGPIVRASTFLPQFELLPHLDRAGLHSGLWRIATGLLKKVAIADVLGAYLVDPVYGQPELYSEGVHLLALYGFALQIYFDFSGYSDIAIGTAKLMGFDLPENFDLPYRSRSVREFWRRWHISLSTWVRDYVYFPLGGSRGSELRVSRNLLLTMFVIGIWHGASALWALYGLLQGSVMVLERALERARGGGAFARSLPSNAIAWALTFHFTVFSLLFIRARDLNHFADMLTSFGEQGLASVHGYAWLALAGGVLTHFLAPSLTAAVQRRFLALPTVIVGLVVGLAAGCVAVLVVGDTPYIYFQF